MSLLTRLARRFSSGSTTTTVDVPVLKTFDSPQEFWIELTSKCPFDCVFCSRASLRGKGEHMDFALYQSLISQMRRPRIIRLNYSGESIHYPHLAKAISLAKATGARVELVTALSSAKPKIIEALVREKLDRLTISIHALSEPLYQQIYGYSSSNSLNESLQLLLSLKQKLNSFFPVIDFAFVAMERNLEELPSIAALAQAMGVVQIDIHPVIRRDEIAEAFSNELIAGNLTAYFHAKLSKSLIELAQNYPNLSLNVSSKELEKIPDLGVQPVAYPLELPQGAKIFSCEQNPWDTVHVLANGDVVSCEVRDQQPLGNLTDTDLHSIWHGSEYATFRRNYVQAVDEKCRKCIYKFAYTSSDQFEIKSYLRPTECQNQLLSGWHLAEAKHVWSSTYNARALLAWPSGASRIIISGLLPPSERDEENNLRVIVAGVEHCVVNSGDKHLPFHVDIRMPTLSESIIRIDFNISHTFSPQKQNPKADARQLGFLLSEIRCH